MQLTISNYRCFPDPKRVRLDLLPGFTALLGTNNAGKSSLLRFFYEFQNLFQTLANPEGPLAQALKSSHAFSFQGLRHSEDVFCNHNHAGVEIEVLTSLSPKFGLRLTVPRAQNVFLAAFVNHAEVYRYQANDPVRMNHGKLYHGENVVADFSSIFEAFATLGDTLYIGSFRNPINVGAQSAYFGLRVGDDFVKAWKDFKMGNEPKKREAAIRVTDDIKRLFNYRSLEINPSYDDRDLQVVVNGKSQWLSEMGSGLAQFILVLVNAAIRKPSFALIDEPETSLHPPLQLDFLTSLADHTQHGVIFATHSYGLARAAADRIYGVRGDQEAGSTVTIFDALPHLATFVGELSLSSYKELGFEKILLVEGPTDVRTVQQFLRFYKKDHQIVLIPLGGSSMIHKDREAELAEMTRITPEVYVLIDSERASPNAPLSSERAGFVKACERAKVKNCHVLERRATENYLTEDAIKAVKKDEYRALGHYENLDDVSPHWGKAENWRIARQMSPADIEGTDLGDFLKSL
jgi:ABC-type cobalamin/Fe3+-siderophores transport system ATPase subunit